MAGNRGHSLRKSVSATRRSNWSRNNKTNNSGKCDVRRTATSEKKPQRWDFAVTVTIRPAAAADLSTTIALLRAAGLPVDDVSLERLALVAEVGGKLQGVIGVESFGDTALLRSLGVSDEARSGGVGSALVNALESTCMASDVSEMWLLTIDADAFFRKLGYSIRARDDAPRVIRETREFSSLCPGDAILMRKILAF